MAQPVLYYIRHGETDWNVERRLQGRHDIPLNANGRRQAEHCGVLLHGLFAREGRGADSFDYLSSPLSRARDTMALVRRGVGLPAEGYRIEPELVELSFGDWEGFTLAELQSRDSARVAARAQDKWGFEPPGGESYVTLTRRIAAWYEALRHDTVVVAHGGTARALIAHLGIVPQRAAPLYDVDQGVVYVFAGGRLTRHA